MKIIMFGTGNAIALEYYNTCFMLQENNFNLLVDGGGGNGILKKLKKHNVKLNDIHHIFLTHIHTDHLFGVIWIIRMIGQLIHRNQYQGELNIYTHDEAIKVLNNICKELLPPIALKSLGLRIKLNIVENNQTVNIQNKQITFFDLGSKKIKQFGFTTTSASGKKITCLGDVPYNPTTEQYVKDTDLLMHEAFCLESEAEEFKPYEKSHSTVKEPSVLAENMNISNLLLYHTADNKSKKRKKLYTNEAKQYFSGNVFVPDDDETIDI